MVERGAETIWGWKPGSKLGKLRKLQLSLQMLQGVVRRLLQGSESVGGSY